MQLKKQTTPQFSGPRSTPLPGLGPLVDPALQPLIAEARRVAQLAYCPHSHFPVGAAIEAEGGEVCVGCNVENASFGLTICAERNAAFQMVSHGRRQIRTVVIYTPTAEPTAPCGACRQVLNEFGPRARVVSVCDGPGYLDTTLDRLLPHAFGPGNLSGLT
ncbi:MAG: cytidine deaminase [Planctomycetaceae bacterium]|jgi:cytidine deaminase